MPGLRVWRHPKLVGVEKGKEPKPGGKIDGFLWLLHAQLRIIMYDAGVVRYT